MDHETLKEAVSVFLEKLGVATDEVRVTSGVRTVVAVTTPHTEILIGPNGEHLHAINALVRRLIEQKYGVEATNFHIDVNDYHEGRMEKIRQEARVLAQRARVFKHDVELGPMNPYERLVIHELFAEDPQIQTVSEGEGKFRHIVLKYK